jgi:hypothetical protein
MAVLAAPSCRLPRLGDGLYRLVAGLSMVERDHSCQSRSRVTRGHVLTTGLANRGRRPTRLVAGGGPLHRCLFGLHLDHGPPPPRAPCLRERANARTCERSNVLAGELAGECACAKLYNFCLTCRLAARAAADGGQPDNEVDGDQARPRCR